MSNTFTSGQKNVSGGDTTTHDTTAIEGDINILSAQCRWQGVDVTEGGSSTSTNTSSSSEVSHTYTNEEKTEDAINAHDLDLPDTRTYPDPPSGGVGSSFSHHNHHILLRAGINVDNTDDLSVEWEADNASNTSKVTGTVTLDGNTNDYLSVYDTDTTDNTVGEDVTVEITNVEESGYDSGNVEVTHYARTYADVTYFDGYVADSIPSAPSGYTFDHHDASVTWENTGGQQVTVDIKWEFPWFGYGAKTSSVTLNSGETHQESGSYSTDMSGMDAWGDITNNTTNIDVIVETSSTGTDDTTTTYHTENPEVQNDVNASYTGTLSDGEWTSWIDMTGLAEGVNYMDHRIGGSNEAVFQFEYTYEKKTATRLGRVTVYNDNTNSKIDLPLVDPGDSLLDYNVWHVYNHTDGTTYAVDVVDPSDQYATNSTFFHPTHGKLAVNEYNP